MTTPVPVRVRPATAADRERSAAVLAAAFGEDPLFTHLFPPGMRRREARIRRFFALELPRGERLGGAWTSGDGSGAAIWYPPGAWRPSGWETLRQTPAAMRVFGRKLVLASRAEAVMRAHHPQRPHWYLYYLGAEPGRQGAGIGTALLRPVLGLCDQQGLPAYLEATCERNRDLYLRHGFVGSKPLTLPDDGPVLFPMWREPAP